MFKSFEKTLPILLVITLQYFAVDQKHLIRNLFFNLDCCSLFPCGFVPQLGIAIGFLVPPILVPNVEDMDELASHIQVMFYITAGVATFLFILVLISKDANFKMFIYLID